MPKKVARANPPVVWQAAPEEHDYPAARSYLTLLAVPEMVDAIVQRLRATDSATFKAKDLLRAAGLEVLPATNVHVAADLRKIAKGTPLSPVLIVRGDVASGRPAQIADGYHRVCASHHTDENTDVTVRIVDLPVDAPGSPAP